MIDRVMLLAAAREHEARKRRRVWYGDCPFCGGPLDFNGAFERVCLPCMKVLTTRRPGWEFDDYDPGAPETMPTGYEYRSPLLRR